MLSRLPALSLLLALAAPSPLSLEFERLKVHTALLVTSSSLSETPLWSPDSKHLGFNTEHMWEQIDLSILRLQAGTWRGLPIAAIRWRGAAMALDDAEAAEWKKSTKLGTESLEIDASNRLQVQVRALTTTLSVVHNGQTKPLWSIEGDRCKHLALSPDGKWLALQFESDGILVSEVSRLLAGL